MMISQQTIDQVKEKLIKEFNPLALGNKDK